VQPGSLLREGAHEPRALCRAPQLQSLRP